MLESGKMHSTCPLSTTAHESSFSLWSRTSVSALSTTPRTIHAHNFLIIGWVSSLNAYKYTVNRTIRMLQVEVKFFFLKTKSVFFLMKNSYVLNQIESTKTRRQMKIREKKFQLLLLLQNE